MRQNIHLHGQQLKHEHIQRLLILLVQLIPIQIVPMEQHIIIN